MTKPTPATTICFDAELPAAKGSIALPAGAQKPAPVEGTINGFPFRSRLDGEAAFTLDAAIRTAAGVSPGDTVRLEITRIGDEADVRPPAELIRALATHADARATWEATTPLARRDWVLWITTAKKPETRLKRIRDACDKLARGNRRVCCFPGLNWLTRDHVKPEQTWMPLPKRT